MATGHALRVAADLTGDGRADIVGFGDAGVYVSLNLGGGLRPPAVLTPSTSHVLHSTLRSTP